jgi:predicted dehydrogenase
LHGVFHVPPGSGEAIAAHYAGPKARRGPQRMLEHLAVDAFAVAAPDQTHTPPPISARQPGKDGWVEKPLALTPYHGLHMLEAARPRLGLKLLPCIS